MEYRVTTLPAAHIGFGILPEDVIDEVNHYLDLKLRDPLTADASATLVGQIKNGRQLMLDRHDSALSSLSGFILNSSIEFIRVFYESAGLTVPEKTIGIESVWSVHSFEGDYNPIHSHRTKSGMGISFVIYTKVPPAITALEAKSFDGSLVFLAGSAQPWQSDILKPSGQLNIKPREGALYVFPSWLEHVVYPFSGDGERRTVAGNVNISD